MLIVHWGHRIAVLKLSFFDLVHPFLSQMPLAMRLKSSSHSSIFFCVEYGEVHSSSGFQYFIENIGMRSDHWRRQTCWDPRRGVTMADKTRWWAPKTSGGLDKRPSAELHWCPSLVSLPSNVGCCKFDKLLPNLSCWVLIWNPFYRCQRSRSDTAGCSHSLWKARGTECEDGSFIYPQPLGTVLAGLPGRPLQQLFGGSSP